MFPQSTSPMLTVPRTNTSTLSYDGSYFGSNGGLVDSPNVSGSTFPEWGTGAGGTTQATQSTYVDPYAKWGGQTGYNNYVNNFNDQQNTAWSTGMEAGDSTYRNYNLGIQGYLDSARLGQSNIDRSRARNYLGRLQGMNGIMGMVGRGIRSGGVQLANRNAGDSSATGALAAAYGDMGRRQAASVGNQYELGNQDIDAQQNAQNVQTAAGKRELENSKINAVDNITRSYVTEISNINAQMVNADMPTRINLEQKKTELKAALNQKLSALDQYLTEQSSQIKAADFNTTRGTAQGMYTTGTDLGADAFNFTDQVPGQFQNTGPFSSELPLFLAPRRRGE